MGMGLVGGVVCHHGVVCQQGAARHGGGRKVRSVSGFGRKRVAVRMMSGASSQGPERMAGDGDTVLVHYRGTLEDGTVFDESYGRGTPLEFQIGGGRVIKGFDSGARGLRRGEKRSVVVPPEDGYGQWSEENVVSVPAQPGMDLQAGARVQLNNGAQATVTKVTDEEITLDVNHFLAGKTLNFEVELVGFKQTVADPVAPAGMELATVALGCFWGAELAYQREPGVVSTWVGYTQGAKEDPTYEEVCSGATGHAEAVHIVYDPKVVSYDRLLELFWERLGGSALTLNQVGNDMGTQYRSGIYPHSAEQRAAAEASKKAADAKFGEPTVVEVVDASTFYLAEDYHQQYLEKGGQSAEKGAKDMIRCYG